MAEAKVSRTKTRLCSTRHPFPIPHSMSIVFVGLIDAQWTARWTFNAILPSASLLITWKDDARHRRVHADMHLSCSARPGKRHKSRRRAASFDDLLAFDTVAVS